MTRWGEKRYYSLDYYLKETYGEKLYKISLNGGMTCPNRDGTLGARGCIFCSAGGSGDFASDVASSISEQIEQGKALIANKYTGHGYIAYFQAYTNTYGTVSHLRSIFEEALNHPDIRILSIATRPDCLSPEILALLAELNQQKPIWIELGLQTIHEKSAVFIRRGYELDVFKHAVQSLRTLHIPVITHVILGLPTEDRADMLQTILYLNRLDIQGIKLQLLHVLRNTDLALLYEESPFPLPTMEEYMDILGLCLSRLRPDIVIHRLTGDGPKKLLIAPLYTANKRIVMNAIQRTLKEQDLWQGKYYE